MYLFLRLWERCCAAHFRRSWCCSDWGQPLLLCFRKRRGSLRDQGTSMTGLSQGETENSPPEVTYCPLRQDQHHVLPWDGPVTWHQQQRARRVFCPREQEQVIGAEVAHGRDDPERERLWLPLPLAAPLRFTRWTPPSRGIVTVRRLIVAGRETIRRADSDSCLAFRRLSAPSRKISELGCSSPNTRRCDDTKLAVAQILGDGTRKRTQSFSELQSHYLFGERFGRSRKRQGQGKRAGGVCAA